MKTQTQGSKKQGVPDQEDVAHQPSADEPGAGDHRTLVQFSEEEFRKIKSDADSAGESVPVALKRAYFGEQETPLSLFEDQSDDRVGVAFDQFLENIGRYVARAFQLTDYVGIRALLALCSVAAVVNLANQNAFGPPAGGTLMEKWHDALSAHTALSHAKVGNKADFGKRVKDTVEPNTGASRRDATTQDDEELSKIADRAALTE